MLDANVYSAFDALPDTNGANHPHEVILDGTIEGVGENATLTIIAPVAEIEKARKGNATQRGVGFRLTVAFELDGRPYELHANWVSLKRRQH